MLNIGKVLSLESERLKLHLFKLYDFEESLYPSDSFASCVPLTWSV